LILFLCIYQGSDEVLTKLKSLQVDGSQMNAKKACIHEVIQEAKRLKKAQLVSQLELYLQSIQ